MDATTIGTVLRARMRAQADLFASVSSHGTLIGSGRERALVDLLQQIVARRYEVLTGTVASRDGKAAEQIDIMIADTVEFPTLLRAGEIAVVHAPALRVVIEVKSDLKRGADFQTAMIQLGRIRNAIGVDGEDVLTALYCFAAPTNNETLRDWLGDVIKWRKELAADRDAAAEAIANAGDDKAKKEATGRHLKAERALEDLRGDNLPDLIVSDRGAIARAVELDDATAVPDSITYEFVSVPDGAPTVLVLMEQIANVLAGAFRDADQKTAYLNLVSWGADLTLDTTVSAVDVSGR